MTAPLRAQMEAFAVAYVANGGNGTQAAITAGYGEKSAHVRASRLLKDTRVQERIADLTAKVAAKVERERADAVVRTKAEEAITREQGRDEAEARAERLAERVIEELVAIGFAKATDYASWTEDEVRFIRSEDLTDDAKAAIAEVSADISEVITDDGKDGAPDTLHRRTRLRVKPHDKLGALRMLGQHLGIITRHTEVQHRGSIDQHHRHLHAVIVHGGETGIEAPAPATPMPTSEVRVIGELQPGAAVSPATRPDKAGREWNPVKKGERAKRLAEVRARARRLLEEEE